MNDRSIKKATTLSVVAFFYLKQLYIGYHFVLG